MATVSYIFSDLNVRDEFVSSSTDVLIYDAKDIIQSLWRLLTTEEGEIPNYRNYGMNLKRYQQYPLTAETIEEMYEYIKGKIDTYETRVVTIRADVDVDFEQEVIYFTFYERLKFSGEVIKIPTFSVQVSTS